MILRIGCAVLLSLPLVCRAEAVPKTVHFKSTDEKTELVAYLFEPTTSGPHPAIVLLHGRSGAYSSLAKGVYNAETLSKRHKFWGHFWADHGYVALLVDSFGPRNYPGGFPKGSHGVRPPEVSEETVRPLDAYGALRYLRTNSEVDPDRIGVQGWSNGAMTTLVTMSAHSPGIVDPTEKLGFRAAMAEYPGCHMAAVQGEYHNYAPILMLLATADEEVGYKGCESWAKRAKSNGDHLDFFLEEGAVHDYDDPSKTKQEVPANRLATEDTIRRGEEFFAKYLKKTY